MFATNIPESAVPLYLNYEDPASGAIVSHNTASHNVLLKITLPKRTGRKRKRATDGPWQGEVVEMDTDTHLDLNDASTLRQKIKDNQDDHEVEVVGLVKQTHRYRGKLIASSTYYKSDAFANMMPALADYHIRTDQSAFMNSFVENVIPGEGIVTPTLEIKRSTNSPFQSPICVNSKRRMPQINLDKST